MMKCPIVYHVIGENMTLMEQIEKRNNRILIRKIIDAIENSGCVIVNPNYNPVKGMENGLILRSADKEWLVDITANILLSLEQEEGHNGSV